MDYHGDGITDIYANDEGGFPQVQYELKIDKELESLCPALSADELSLLEKSIEDEGCRDEIVLWANHDKTVIDGHNRYRICQKLGKPYKTLSLQFDSKDEVKLWMLRNQMGRRNLNESQRAMMAARMAAASHGGDRRSDQAANLPVSQAEAAEKFGVSERTVRSAKIVEANGTAELQAAVTNGDVSVSAAAEVAKKPKAEQKKIVAKGPKAVKAAAKQSKAAAAKETEPLPEIVPIDPNGFDPANIEAHALSFAANFAAKVKAHNLEIDRYCRRVSEAFEKEIPIGAWLDDSRVGMARDSINSAIATLRQAKAHDKPCPKCDGKGTNTGKPCKNCRGVGYMPKVSYEMAGGK